jgi:hypothetical protein
MKIVLNFLKKFNFKQIRKYNVILNSIEYQKLINQTLNNISEKLETIVEKVITYFF